MRNQKWSSILIALVYIALGLVFIVRPLGVESALCYVLAATLAVLGILYLIGYFITPAGDDGRRSGNGLAIGVIIIFLAIFVMARQDMIITLVPFLFGIMVLIRGLMVLETSFFIRKRGYSMKLTLNLGLLLTAFGLFIMLFPLETGPMLFILIGCGLLAGGVSSLVEQISLRSMRRRREHEAERRKDMGPKIKTYESDDGEESGVPDESGDKEEAASEDVRVKSEASGDKEEAASEDVRVKSEASGDKEETAPEDAKVK